MDPGAGTVFRRRFRGAGCCVAAAAAMPVDDAGAWPAAAAAAAALAAVGVLRAWLSRRSSICVCNRRRGVSGTPTPAAPAAAAAPLPAPAAGAALAAPFIGAEAGGSSTVMDRSRRLRLPPVARVLGALPAPLVFTASSDFSVWDRPAGTDDAGKRWAWLPSSDNPVSDFCSNEKHRMNSAWSVDFRFCTTSVRLQKNEHRMSAPRQRKPPSRRLAQRTPQGRWHRTMQPRMQTRMRQCSTGQQQQRGCRQLQPHELHVRQQRVACSSVTPPAAASASWRSDAWNVAWWSTSGSSPRCPYCMTQRRPRTTMVSPQPAKTRRPTATHRPGSSFAISAHLLPRRFCAS